MSRLKLGSKVQAVPNANLFRVNQYDCAPRHRERNTGMTLHQGSSVATRLALGASAAVEAAAITQSEPEGLFTFCERDGHWWLTTSN